MNAQTSVGKGALAISEKWIAAGCVSLATRHLHFQLIRKEAKPNWTYGLPFAPRNAQKLTTEGGGGKYYLVDRICCLANASGSYA